MHQFISETAKYGDLTRGPRVVDRHTKKEMKKILHEIQSGKFARQWITENKRGRRNYEALLRKGPRTPDRAGRPQAQGPDALAERVKSCAGRLAGGHPGRCEPSPPRDATMTEMTESRDDLRHHAARRDSRPAAA